MSEMEIQKAQPLVIKIGTLDVKGKPNKKMICLVVKKIESEIEQIKTQHIAEL